MNKKKLIIIVSILAVIGLVVMLFVLPKPKTNNTAKQEAITETSSSKESSKKNDGKKNQTSKKDDRKKEDKKEDATNTSSETPAVQTSGTEVTQNNSTGSSVTNTPSTNTTPAPQPIYQTIHHDEVGHWETQVIRDAWDEPVYERKIIGNQTGTIYPSVDAFIENTNGDGSYHVGDVQVGTTHHDAVTQQVWVVDQYAWDETIIVGYK